MKYNVSGDLIEAECDCCGVELEADPPQTGEHQNLCHQCNEDEAK